MLTFEIEIIRAGKPTPLRVEELDLFPDADGHVRYRVQGDERISVLWVDRSYWDRPYIMTEEDAWEYLEKILYPQPGRVYSEDFVFSPEELELIRQGIGKFIINRS